MQAGFQKLQDAEHNNTGRYRERKIVCMQRSEEEKIAGYRPRKRDS